MHTWVHATLLLTWREKTADGNSTQAFVTWVKCIVLKDAPKTAAKTPQNHIIEKQGSNMPVPSHTKLTQKSDKTESVFKKH